MPNYYFESEEFIVNTYTDNNQFAPSVTSLSDGGFVATWTSDVQDGSDYGIYGQRYNSDGTMSGAEFQINTYTNGNQWAQSTTGLSSGGFIVTWMSHGQDGNQNGIYGQLYNADGTLSGTEFQVNSYIDGSQSYPFITSLSDGGFVVAWMSHGQDGSQNGIYGQRYNADGTTHNEEFLSFFK